MRACVTTEDLIAAASAPYWKTDFTGYFRARGKLRGDPAFTRILSEGLLARAERILDLGCGQGLLAAWLDAARRRQDERPHLWPAAWPAAPRPTSYRGIEMRRQEVWRAQIALGGRAEFEVGDITDHSSDRVHLTRNRDLDDIVVAVSVRVIALAVDLLVTRCITAFDVKAMRGAEAIASGEICLHGSP